MKRETAFTIAMLLLGIVAGIAVVIILMAIAAPSTSQYLLTFAEQRDYERIGSYSSYMTGPGSWIVYGVFFAALLLALSLFLATINPQIKNARKQWRSVAGAKLLVVLLAVLGWLYGLSVGSDSLFTSVQGTLKAVVFIIYAIGTAGVWLIAGEQGWAGDFSSWRMRKDAPLLRTALLGAVAGTASFVVHQLFTWSFNKYFILVSEVLDGSGETSFLGFVQLAFGLVTCVGTALPLIAGFVTALAPVDRGNGDIQRRLIFPGAALLVICAVLAAAYGYAGAKYDLNKKDLAAALGIPDKAGDSRTIVLFLPSKELPVTIQEWPLKVSSSGFMSQNTIELSKESLQKVESYLAAHRDGTVFTYPGREILVKGYYALWDVEKGLAWQQKAAESQLLHRQMMLARFRSAAVTPENLKLLESYSNEKTWHAGGKSALYLSMAYQHFGKAAEASKWLEKTIALGTDISKADFVKDPIVTSGALRGKILLNGKPLSGVKVALLSHSVDKPGKENFKLMDFSLPRVLVDVKQTDKDGRFAFSSLGTGKYLIAIMTDKETIPYDLKAGTITAGNVPGLISIGTVASRDLGTIAIVRK